MKERPWDYNAENYSTHTQKKKKHGKIKHWGYRYCYKYKKQTFLQRVIQ